MELSVVLPVYNAPDDVAVCLDSLERHFSGKNRELLILDDASGPETATLLTAFVRRMEKRTADRPVVRLLTRPENRGYLLNVNQGLAETDGDVVVLLNSDTAIPEGFADRVLACFASDPTIAWPRPWARIAACSPSP